MGCRIVFEKAFVLPTSFVQRKLTQWCPCRGDAAQRCACVVPQTLRCNWRLELSIILQIHHHVDQPDFFFFLFVCTSWTKPCLNAFINDCFGRGLLHHFLVFVQGAVQAGSVGRGTEAGNKEKEAGERRVTTAECWNFHSRIAVVGNCSVQGNL